MFSSCFIYERHGYFTTAVVAITPNTLEVLHKQLTMKHDENDT